jgi:hypothetical protein
VQKGDIITHIEDTRVKTEEQFLRRLWELPIHREFQISLLRHNMAEIVSIRSMDFYDFYDIGGSEEMLGH